jgi:hypothetical protein
VPLSAFLSVGIRAGVAASDSEGRGVTLRSFAGRLPRSRTRSAPRRRDLRYTRATMLLRQGVHPKVVQDRLGHANVGITLDVYSHVSPHMQSDAAEKIDAGLRAALAGSTRTRLHDRTESARVGSAPRQADRTCCMSSSVYASAGLAPSRAKSRVPQRSVVREQMARDVSTECAPAVRGRRARRSR